MPELFAAALVAIIIGSAYALIREYLGGRFR